MPKSQVELKRSLKTCEQCVKSFTSLFHTPEPWLLLPGTYQKPATLQVGDKLCLLLNDTGPNLQELKHLIVDYKTLINEKVVLGIWWDESLTFQIYIRKT